MPPSVVARTVLLVDDHPLFRDGLAALLATIEDTEVVGLAGDGDRALLSRRARDRARLASCPNGKGVRTRETGKARPRKGL